MATDVETEKLKRCYENAHEEPVYRLLNLDSNKIVTGMLSTPLYYQPLY